MALRDEAEAIVMDWRSLRLRDGAMALCYPAVDMDLWKLAPINDISKVLRSIPDTWVHDKGAS